MGVEHHFLQDGSPLAPTNPQLSLADDQELMFVPGYRYLRGETQCLLCPKSHGQPRGFRLSDEHIVPEVTCTDFEDSLGDLEDADPNHVSLCRGCHDGVDNGRRAKNGDPGVTGKNKTYRVDGILGVVQYIASYPRSPYKGFFNRQHDQWVDLFDLLDERLPVQRRLIEEDLNFVQQRPVDSIEGFKRRQTDRIKLEIQRTRFARAHEEVQWHLFVWREVGDFALEATHA